MSDQNKRNEDEPQVPPVVGEDPGVEDITVGGLGAGLTNSRRQPAPESEGEPTAEGGEPEADAAPDDASRREADAKIRDSARETGEKVAEAAEAEAAAEENQNEQPLSGRQRRFKDAFGAIMPDDELSDLMEPRRNIRGQEYIKYGDNAQMTRNHDGSISLRAKANAVETRMAVKHSLEIMRQQGFTSIELKAKRGSHLGNMQWLEARKMGFEVEGFTPSPEAKQAYLDHRAALERQTAANQAPNDPTPPAPPADTAPAAETPEAKGPDNKGPDGNGPDGKGPDGNGPQGPTGAEPAAADNKPADAKGPESNAPATPAATDGKTAEAAAPQAPAADGAAPKADAGQTPANPAADGQTPPNPAQAAGERVIDGAPKGGLPRGAEPAMLAGGVSSLLRNALNPNGQQPQMGGSKPGQDALSNLAVWRDRNPNRGQEAKSLLRELKSTTAIASTQPETAKVTDKAEQPGRPKFSMIQSDEPNNRSNSRFDPSDAKSTRRVQLVQAQKNTRRMEQIASKTNTVDNSPRFNMNQRRNS